MALKIKYPVGIHTFANIIEDNFFYVDKTALMYRLIKESRYVFLSRPRRFGKSLLMSTLEAYFKGRKDLFRNLAVESLEKEWKEFPVFRFDLSGENFINPQRLIEHIEFYLDKYEEIYGISSSGSISKRFKQLIFRTYTKFSKKVVILIDEYDKPLLDCLGNEHLHEDLKNELRSFYSCIKASDEYIQFAMLTGVTKFGKVSVFSGLNNLRDISLNPDYNDLCGISENEFIRDFKDSIDLFSLTRQVEPDYVRSRFKEMYDGYRFAKRGQGIYNPFSVLSAFMDNELKGYWFSTGSSSYLIRLIETHSFRLDKLEGEKRNEEQLGNISDVTDDFIPLLYQSGYLTLKGYDEESGEYILGFPNREVYEAFWSSLKNHFFKTKGGDNLFDTRLFCKDLEEGNPERFMRRMRSLFADTSSESERNKEIHFQNMMAIVAKMLGLTVRTEVHSSAGRADMLILLPKQLYVFEFKINGSAEEAILQIKEKGYGIPYEIDGREQYLIGANFSTHSRTLTEWIIEKVEIN